ncbi:single-stranded DNA-binding protein [Actinoplanes sp. NPDC023714]|uniref:single-stranded DNA-binding protein n=1 Tax=Actinoplanes sp. NPDC023714 TaxID=3154322 RepID=UPI0033F1B328
MFETNIVIVGNVLNMPEWRRTTHSQQLVANFRVASTARRFDKESGRWVDGNSLRVRVTAWRRLAEGVTSSIRVGDPVIVYGRIYTRDWVDDDKKKRISYEMEAFSIGHDLSRGRGRFYRNKPGAALSVVDDLEHDAQIRGEASVTLADDEAPVRYGDGVPAIDEPAPDVPPAGEPDPAFLEVVSGLAEEPATAHAEEPEQSERRSEQSEGRSAQSERRSAQSERRERPGQLERPEGDAGSAASTGPDDVRPADPRRGRRGARREPVAA